MKSDKVIPILMKQQLTRLPGCGRAFEGGAVPSRVERCLRGREEKKEKKKNLKGPLAPLPQSSARFHQSGPQGGPKVVRAKSRRARSGHCRALQPGQFRFQHGLLLSDCLSEVTTVVRDQYNLSLTLPIPLRRSLVLP